MSTYLDCSKEDLVKLISERASKKAEELGIQHGGIIVRLYGRESGAKKWIGEDGQYTAYCPFGEKEDKSNIVYQIPQDQLDVMINEAISRLHSLSFDDYRLVCNDYGTSFCYQILTLLPHSMPMKITAMYIIVVFGRSNSSDERAVILDLHPALEEWCKKNGKFIPELDLR